MSRCKYDPAGSSASRMSSHRRSLSHPITTRHLDETRKLKQHDAYHLTNNLSVAAMKTASTNAPFSVIPRPKTHAEGTGDLIQTFKLRDIPGFGMKFCELTLAHKTARFEFGLAVPGPMVGIQPILQWAVGYDVCF